MSIAAPLHRAPLGTPSIRLPLDALTQLSSLSQYIITSRAKSTRDLPPPSGSARPSQPTRAQTTRRQPPHRPSRRAYPSRKVLQAFSRQQVHFLPHRPFCSSPHPASSRRRNKSPSSGISPSHHEEALDFAPLESARSSSIVHGPSSRREQVVVCWYASSASFPRGVSNPGGTNDRDNGEARGRRSKQYSSTAGGERDRHYSLHLFRPRLPPTL